MNLYTQYLTPVEVARARSVLLSSPSLSLSTESFVSIAHTADTAWLYAKLLDAGAKTLHGSRRTLVAADELILDRFGPRFSSPHFAWHTDAMVGDGREVSIVAYLSPTDAYVGGDFLVECDDHELDSYGAQLRARQVGAASTELHDGRTCARFRFEPGDCIAFRSSALEHCVTTVESGERVSCLLIGGHRDFDRSMTCSGGSLGTYAAAASSSSGSSLAHTHL